ncbi:MAG: hypothetical protein AB1324_03000 [Candidatus Micrarchaeota archaeon]
MTDPRNQLGPYRKAALPTPEGQKEEWRHISPIQDKLPLNRLGQYVGPISRDETVEVAGVGFRYLPGADRLAEMRIQVPGCNPSPKQFPLGKKISWKSDGLEIHAFVYFMDENSVRCSILVDRVWEGNARKGEII